MSKKCPAWHHLECAGLDYEKTAGYYKQTFYACLECWRPHPKPKDYIEVREAQIIGRPVRQTANKARQKWVQLHKDNLVGPK